MCKWRVVENGAILTGLTLYMYVVYVQDMCVHHFTVVMALYVVLSVFALHNSIIMLSASCLHITCDVMA